MNLADPRFRLHFGSVTISYWRHKGRFDKSRALRIETKAGTWRIERKDMRFAKWSAEVPKTADAAPVQPAT